VNVAGWGRRGKKKEETVPIGGAWGQAEGSGKRQLGKKSSKGNEEAGRYNSGCGGHIERAIDRGIKREKNDRGESSARSNRRNKRRGAT